VLKYIPGTSYIGGKKDFQIGRLGEKKDDKEKTGEDFKGEIRDKQPTIIDITSSWKRAQESVVETPEMRLQKEHLAEGKQTNTYLGRITANTGATSTDPPARLGN
jgi:hypothetical protein